MTFIIWGVKLRVTCI